MVKVDIALACVDLLIVLRFLILADATWTLICWHKGVVDRVNNYLGSTSSNKMGESARKQMGGAPVADERSGSANFRMLHLLLFGINFMNGLQSAVNLCIFFGGRWEVSCEVPLAAMELLSELGIFFLILFLVAKLKVANSHRLAMISHFEQAVIFVNKVLALILYPGLAMFFGFELWVAMNKEGSCTEEREDVSSLREHHIIVAAAISGLVVQTVQILSLLFFFIQPLVMQSHAVGTSVSTSNVYREVIVRNVFGTAGIVLTLMASTTFTLLYEERYRFQAHTGRILFLIDSVKNLLILAFTEVTHRSGIRGCISSMIRSMKAGHRASNSRVVSIETDGACSGNSPL
ncbi:unnamed protein product [Choristocarpus tenellus]